MIGKVPILSSPFILHATNAAFGVVTAVSTAPRLLPLQRVDVIWSLKGGYALLQYIVSVFPSKRLAGHYAQGMPATLTLWFLTPSDSEHLPKRAV